MLGRGKLPEDPQTTNRAVGIRIAIFSALFLAMVFLLWRYVAAAR